MPDIYTLDTEISCLYEQLSDDLEGYFSELPDNNKQNFPTHMYWLLMIIKGNFVKRFIFTLWTLEFPA